MSIKLPEKPRYEKWNKFLSKNNLVEIFDSLLIDETDSYPEVAFRIKNNLNHRPNCKCGNFVKFNQNHYTEFCSVACQAKYNSQKRLNSYKEKTGYTHPHHNPEIKNKMKQKCQEKYGVDHQWKSEKIQQKVKNTCIERYGAENPLQNKDIQEKIKQTNLKKYGYNWALCNQEWKEKKMLDKHGVRNCMHMSNQRNGYKWYEYKLPSGKIIKCQGYEQRYIPILIRKFGENNIIFEKSKIPKIKYVLNNVDYYYFPDFYIPNENLIVEVKSKYTMEANYNKNLLKFSAVIKSGYKFKLKIFP